MPELCRYPWVSLMTGTITRNFLNTYFAERGLPFAPAIELATTDLILPAIEHNLGIGFLPPEFVRGALDMGSVFQIHFPDEMPHRRIFKVLRQRHFENLCWNISVTYKKAFSYSIRKAKPVLCFARIAKAILGGITLHNSIFLFHKKTPLQEQNSCGGVVFLTKLAAYRKGLFILWSVPFPIANFFKILTILSDILLMLNKLVVHLLDEVGTTVC